MKNNMFKKCKWIKNNVYVDVNNKHVIKYHNNNNMYIHNYYIKFIHNKTYII